MTEQFANHSGITPEPFQTSRARADQGAGRGARELGMEMDLQDQVQTSPRHIPSPRFGFGIQP